MKTAPGLPTAVAKIAIGVVATGLAYVPLVIAALLGSDGSMVGLGWLFGCLGLLSVGELLIGARSLVLWLAPTARGVAGLGPGTVRRRLASGWRAASVGGGTECLTRCSSSGWPCWRCLVW